jgi:hypothetical protein
MWNGMFPLSNTGYGFYVTLAFSVTRHPWHLFVEAGLRLIQVNNMPCHNLVSMQMLQSFMAWYSINNRYMLRLLTKPEFSESEYNKMTHEQMMAKDAFQWGGRLTLFNTSISFSDLFNRSDRIDGVFR